MLYCSEVLTSRKWKAEEQIMNRTIDSSEFFELIEELLVAGTTPLVQTLRLLCLFSLANNGIKSKIYDQIRTNICCTLGVQHLITLDRLRKMGLLIVNNGKKSEYSKVVKGFKLMNAYESLVEPKDPSYVFGGYCPLSVKLVQMATNNQSLQKLGDTPSERTSITNSQIPTFKGFEEQLKLLNCNWFEKTIIPDRNIPSNNSKPRRTLVTFIGGCTFAEISALRTLSKNQGKIVD